MDQRNHVGLSALALAAAQADARGHYLWKTLCANGADPTVPTIMEQSAADIAQRIHQQRWRN